MPSLTPARIAFSRLCDWLGDAMLSEHVDFQINAYCTVVQPRSEECDFLEICAVLSDQFDDDRTSVDPRTGVMRGYIGEHLVLVVPVDERRYLRSVVTPTTSGDCV